MLIIVSKPYMPVRKLKHIKEYLGVAIVKLDMRRLCQKPTLRHINISVYKSFNGDVNIYLRTIDLESEHEIQFGENHHDS